MAKPKKPETGEEEITRPMAVPEPSPADCIEAVRVLSMRVTELENWTGKHNRYHFGKEASQG